MDVAQIWQGLSYKLCYTVSPTFFVFGFFCSSYLLRYNEVRLVCNGVLITRHSCYVAVGLLLLDDLQMGHLFVKTG